MEFPVALIEDLYRDARKRIADGVVGAVGVGEDAGAAELRQSVADGDAHTPAIAADRLVDAALCVQGDRRSADENEGEIGKIEPDRSFREVFKQRGRREHEVCLVMHQRVEKPGIEKAHRKRDHGPAEGKRKMRHVGQHVRAAQVGQQRGDGVALEFGKARIAPQAGGSLVQPPVRERHRLVDAAGGAGGVDDRGVVGKAARVGDGRCLILRQKLVHEQHAVDLPELLRERAIEHAKLRRHKLSLHGDVHHHDAAEPQLLPAARQPGEYLRVQLRVAQHQVRQPLRFYHVGAVLLRAEVGLGEHGHRSPGHVQRVERENGVGGYFGEQADARMLCAGHVQRGEHLGIALPLTEHLPVGIASPAVDQRDGVQALVAGGIQLLDEFPALLLDDLSAFDAFLQFCLRDRHGFILSPFPCCVPAPPAAQTSPSCG